MRRSYSMPHLDEGDFENFLCETLSNNGYEINNECYLEGIRWRFILINKEGHLELLVPRVTAALPAYLMERIEVAVANSDIPISWVIPEDMSPDFSGFTPAFLNQLKSKDIGLKVLSGTGLIDIINTRGTLLVDDQDNVTYAIMKDEPFGNLLKMKKVFKRSRKYINYTDRYFKVQNLEIMYEALEDTGWPIKEIKIITHARGDITRSGYLKTPFERFRLEAITKGVIAELKVVCDITTQGHIKAESKLPHARYFETYEEIWSMVPIDAILTGDEDDIKKVKRTLNFSKYWDLGMDIISEWDQVQTICRTAR